MFIVCHDIFLRSCLGNFSFADYSQCRESSLFPQLYLQNVSIWFLFCCTTINWHIVAECVCVHDIVHWSIRGIALVHLLLEAIVHVFVFLLYVANVKLLLYQQPQTQHTTNAIAFNIFNGMFNYGFVQYNIYIDRSFANVGLANVCEQPLANCNQKYVVIDLLRACVRVDAKNDNVIGYLFIFRRG